MLDGSPRSAFQSATARQSTNACFTTPKMRGWNGSSILRTSSWDRRAIEPPNFAPKHERLDLQIQLKLYKSYICPFLQWVATALRASSARGFCSKLQPSLRRPADQAKPPPVLALVLRSANLRARLNACERGTYS